MKASRTLPASPLVSKLDTTDWSRELWKLAYAMARRMVRARDGWTVTDAVQWYQHHAYRRFGIANYETVVAAGSLVFHERLLTWGASGTIDELARQGLVRRTKRPRLGNLTATVPCRALRFEYLRPYGFTIAYTFDRLAAVHLRRSGRAWEVQKRRKRRTAVVLAAERVGVTPRYALTVSGLLVLREAEAKATKAEPALVQA